MGTDLDIIPVESMFDEDGDLKPEFLEGDTLERIMTRALDRETSRVTEQVQNAGVQSVGVGDLPGSGRFCDYDGEDKPWRDQGADSYQEFVNIVYNATALISEVRDEYLGLRLAAPLGTTARERRRHKPAAHAPG